MPRSRCVWWQEMEGKVWSDLRAHHGLASSEESNVWKWQWQGWVIPGDSWLGSKDAVKAFVHLQSVQYTCFLFASVFGICGGKPRRRDQHLTSTCFPWLRNNNNFWYLKQRFFFYFFFKIQSCHRVSWHNTEPWWSPKWRISPAGNVARPQLIHLFSMAVVPCAFMDCFHAFVYCWIETFGE